jgi:ribosome maturation factor RimP
MSAGSRRDRAQRGRAVPRQARRGTAPEAIKQLLAPVVESAGYDLEDITVTPAGKRSLLRVVVDADGGVSLDDVATVSRTVSAALDTSDVMGAGPYVLEVTSPGVDRPLTEPRHWRRATGCLVRAPLTAGGQIEGRVVSADDEAVVIDVAAAPEARRRLGHGELGRGRVLVEFRRDDSDPGDAAPETDGD